MTDTPGQLAIPPKAIADRESAEMLRAWIAAGGLHCTMRVGTWNDAGNWGILLADVARHIANATEEADGTPSPDTLARIRLLFNIELDHPTDEPSGRFVER
jgi:hypothetical protein